MALVFLLSAPLSPGFDEFSRLHDTRFPQTPLVSIYMVSITASPKRKREGLRLSGYARIRTKATLGLRFRSVPPATWPQTGLDNISRCESPFAREPYV